LLNQLNCPLINSTTFIKVGAKLANLELDPVVRWDQKSGPGFSILLTTQGKGQIKTEKQGNFTINKGDAFIIPYESGSWSVTGKIEVLLSRPPAPDAPMSSL
jgi:mannose-6-phosphate isomerase class I